MLNTHINFDLTPYNTFGAPITAAHYLALRQPADWNEVLDNQELAAMPWTVLGGGSNILFTQNIEGLLVHNQIQGLEVVKEGESEVWLKVGGGMNWHQLVLHCVQQGWGGLENLSLIPGTVGASPIQNIGAYGVEVKDVFEEAEAVELASGRKLRFTWNDCDFGYRDSVFKKGWKGKLLITHVTFRLRKKGHKLNLSYGAIQNTLEEMGVSIPTIADVSKAVVYIRESKLPNPEQIGNCGSFFKNPEVKAAFYAQLKEEHPAAPGYPTSAGMVKVPAGWLIEQCGWKGKKVGNVGAYEKQALVLVNHGGAKGSEAWALAKDIQASVNEKFDILLTPEVNIYPDSFR